MERWMILEGSLLQVQGHKSKMFTSLNALLYGKYKMY